MKKTSKIKILILPVLVLLIFLLNACAHRTPVAKINIEEVKANLKYKNIVLRDFKATSEVKSPEAALIECMRSTTDYLQMKSIFKAVEKDSGKAYDEPAMYVDIVLTDLRIVSGAARFWGGVMAGRSHMIIKAKLTDASNGSVIAEQELIGMPGAYGAAWSGGHSDRDLPTKMGFLLGDFILGNVSGKK